MFVRSYATNPVRRALFSVAIGVALAVSPGFSQAQTRQVVPGNIQFSGNLAGTAGVAGATFSLYAEQTGGVALWMETQNVALSESGSYSVLLGSETVGGIPQSIFASGEARWLEVSYTGAEGAPVTQPRVLLVSVPYALKAGDASTLGGLPVSAFVINPKALTARVDAAGGVAAIGDVLPTAAVSGTGTTGQIVQWTDGATGALGDTVITQAGGNIGIGTTAPIGKLNVANQGSASYLTLSAYGADTFDKGFLVRTANGTAGGPTKLNPGNIIFNLYGQGHDGVDYAVSGGISMAVDGAVSAGKVPGVVLFQTADSNGVFAERMRINSAGNVGIGTASLTQKLHVAGTVMATAFSGDGSALTNINASNLSSGTLDNARTSGSNTNTPNALVLRDASGNFSAGTVTAAHAGDGSALTNLTASNIATGTLANARTTGTATNTVSTLVLRDASGNFAANVVTVNSIVGSNVNIRGINYIAGCDTCTALLSSDDQQDFYVNQIGSLTIQSVTCFSDAGSPTIDVRRDNVGASTSASILSGATMNCAQATSSGGGTTTSGGSLTNNTLALNDRLDFVINTADGVTTKRITLLIKALVN